MRRASEAPFEGEVRIRRRTAWHRPRAIPEEPEQRLTPRERQILRCLSQGLGSAAIAHHLSISRTTVRNHAQRILAKLGVHNRLAAVARGYAKGLIPIPESEAGSSPPGKHRGSDETNAPGVPGARGSEKGRGKA